MYGRAFHSPGDCFSGSLLTCLPSFAVSLLVLSPMTQLLTDTSLRWVHLGPVRPFESDRSEYHLFTKSKSIPLKKAKLSSLSSDSTEIKVDDVSVVTASKDTWNIVTKVIRLWVSPTFSGGKLPFSMELVLMDSKGCKIHAS
ncbi:hypothetical protein OROGR_018052 [Orobanche gracilis]